MKVFVLTVILIIGFASYGQSQIVINSRYRPIPYEVLLMEAQVKAIENARMELKFNELKDKAYIFYRNEDWNNFLLYSNYALNTGFYTATLYYDRGVVYERLKCFKQAKKEYKQAKKKGHPYAASALETCKLHEKEFKRHQKESQKNGH